MKKYTVTWQIPGLPSVDFQSEELNTDSYDFSENEYSYDKVDIVLPVTEDLSYLESFTASATVDITYMEVDFGDTNYLAFINYIGLDLSVGDTLLIEEEYYKVNDVSTGSGTSAQVKKATIQRNFDDMHTGHFASSISPMTAYVNGRYTPVGMQGTIKDEDEKLVKLISVTDVISYGSNVIISCDSIIASFDREFTLNYLKYLDEDVQELKISKLLPLVFTNFLSFQEGFWGPLNDIYLKTYDSAEIIINPWKLLLEIVKLRSGYILLEDGIFSAKFMSVTTEFSTPAANMSIYDYMSLEGGYESKLSGTGTKVVYTWKNKEEEEQEEVLISTAGNNTIAGQVTEIDVNLGSSLYIERNKGIASENYLLRNLATIRGLIFGYLTIKVVPTHTYKVGNRYKIDEVEKGNNNDFIQFTPTFLDTVAICYSANNTEARFYIIEEIIKNPISPAIFMYAGTESILYLPLFIENNLLKYLYTEEDRIRVAKNPDYGYLFFNTGDNIQVMNAEDYTLHTSGTISFISSSSNNVSLALGTALVPGNRYILEYDKNGGNNYLNEHLRQGGGRI